MGAYLDKPITETHNEDGGDTRTRFGVSSMQGWRKEMEDAHVSEPNMKDKYNTALYGVFDGHCGAEVARFVGRRIVSVLKAQENFEKTQSATDLGKCLRDTFHSIDRILTACSPEDAKLIESLKNKPKGDAGDAGDGADNEEKREALSQSVASDLAAAKEKGGLSKQQAMKLMFKMMCLEKMKSASGRKAGAEDEVASSAGSMTGGAHRVEAGCTSVVVAIRNDKIVTANAGDSRAVLCRAGKAVALSWDHKPQNPIETARIKKAGGFVSENGRVNGNLNLSRSIGDLKYKQNKAVSAAEQAITAEPDIHIEDLTPEDEFLILACDGIWDVLSRQEAVDEVRKRLRAMKASAERRSDSSSKTEDAASASRNMSAIAADILRNVCLAETTEGAMGKGCDNMTLMIVDLQDPSSGPSLSFSSSSSK